MLVQSPRCAAVRRKDSSLSTCSRRLAAQWPGSEKQICPFAGLVWRDPGSYQYQTESGHLRTFERALSHLQVDHLARPEHRFGNSVHVRYLADGHLFFEVEILDAAAAQEYLHALVR